MRLAVLCACWSVIACSGKVDASSAPDAAADVMVDSTVDAPGSDRPDTAGLGSILCENTSRTRSVGVVDGTKFDEETVGLLEWSATGKSWAQLIGGGLLHLNKTGGVALDAVTANGVLLMPAVFPEPGVSFCVGAATVWRDGKDRRRAVLRDLSRLGACGGATAPLLRLCIGTDAYNPTKDPEASSAISCRAGRVHLVGSVADTPFDVDVSKDLPQLRGTAESLLYETIGIGDGGVASLEIVRTAMEGTGSIWLVLPAEADPARSVVCSAAARVKYGPAHQRIEVLAPHVLGGCPKTTVSGQIEMCSYVAER